MMHVGGTEDLTQCQHTKTRRNQADRKEVEIPHVHLQIGRDAGPHTIVSRSRHNGHPSLVDRFQDAATT